MSQRSTQPIFMHRPTNADLEWLTVSQREIVMTMRLIDPNLTGDALRERVAELLPPDSLFGEDARKFTALYQEMRDFLTRRGVNLVQNSSHWIVRTLANGLHVELEEREIAERFEIDIQKGKSSRSFTASLPPGDSSRPLSEYPERVTHNIAMRFKDAESKFSEDTMECWDEFANTYVQMARDYRLSNEQMLQFLHNLLSKDALRFFMAVVVPNVTIFQQAVHMIGSEYNFPVRQARVKNYLQGLRISSFTATGIETSEALSKVYKLILRLSSQYPASRRGDPHRTEFLKTAVVACDWAREPLSRIAPHNLTFQQLYGELESALHL